MKTIYNTDGERLSKNLITVSLFFAKLSPPSLQKTLLFKITPLIISFYQQLKTDKKKTKDSNTQYKKNNPHIKPPTHHFSPIQRTKGQ